MFCRAAAVGLLAAAAACAPRGPVVDTAARPAGVGGTIAGNVHATGGAPLSGRLVTATHVENGERHESSSASTGGYTIKVPAGTSTLEVEIRPGETLASKPPDTDVNVGDIDAGRDFEITAGQR